MHSSEVHLVTRYYTLYTMYIWFAKILWRIFLSTFMSNICTYFSFFKMCLWFLNVWKGQFCPHENSWDAFFPHISERVCKGLILFLLWYTIHWNYYPGIVFIGRGYFTTNSISLMDIFVFSMYSLVSFRNFYLLNNLSISSKLSNVSV